VRQTTLAGLVIVLAIAVVAFPQTREPIDASKPGPADGWETGSLESVGIDRTRIEAMTASIRDNPSRNIHAVLIERNGRLVYEEYFAGQDEKWGEALGRIEFTRETRHDLRSVTKSIVSALVGIAMDKKVMPGLDTPLVELFPEYADVQTPERRRITLGHALSMTAGLEWNERVPYTDPQNDEIAMTRSADPVRYVLRRPIVSAPGKIWEYNGGLTQVMAAALQQATKIPIRQYANDMLFGPLGITDVEWLGDLAGLPYAASGLRLRPRDLAKFGSLYLHQGRWNGRQIIPPDWVELSTQRHITFPDQSDSGYAYQWWHTCYPTATGPIETRFAVGNGDQRVFVMPALNTVVTVLAGRYNDFSGSPAQRLLTDRIIPSIPAAPAAKCP
jgi:CubicO group peptidase (beta-lactamase class C family)